MNIKKTTVHSVADTRSSVDNLRERIRITPSILSYSDAILWTPVNIKNPLLDP